jgi:putative transposase
MSDRHRDVALFRYSLVRELTDPTMSKAERGVLVRALAERDHVGPDGARVRVSRASLDRWRAAWQRGGFDALIPSAKRPAVPVTPPDVLDLALRLKLEAPRAPGHKFERS